MAKQQSRAARWTKAADEARQAFEEMQALKGRIEDAFSELQSIREEYEQWRDNLPENLQGSTLAEKLDAITSIDTEPSMDDLDAIASALDEVEGADFPLGYGRD